VARRWRGSVVRTSISGRQTFTDWWLTGDHSVDKLSAMGQPTRPTQQPSIVPGSVNECNGLQGWRAGNGRPELHMALQLHFKVSERGLRMRPIGCTPALLVTHSSAAAAGCGIWRYTSVIPLPLPFWIWPHFILTFSISWYVRFISVRFWQKICTKAYNSSPTQ